MLGHTDQTTDDRGHTIDGMRTRRRPQRDTLLFVSYQLALLAIIGVFSVHFYGTNLSKLSFQFRQWDPSWYLSIAHHGYQTTGPRQWGIAFFPLYPLLIRLTMVIVGKDVVAAYIVSAVTSVVGHVVFYRALKSRVELAAGANNALILLACWPTAIYFSLLYTESLYLMLTAGFLYFLFNERLGAAAACAAYAALTRQPGFLCIVPLGLWIVLDTSVSWRARILRLRWCVVAASGYIAFLVLNKYIYDDWFAFNHQLEAHWRKKVVSLTRSIPEAIRFLQHPTWRFGWPEIADQYLVLATPLLLIAWLIVCRKQFERTRWVLLAWGLVQWFGIASAGSPVPGFSWLSSTRYLMLVLPIYVAIADLARNRKAIVYGLSAVSAVFAVMLVERWITWKWAA
jgi:Gpi18-like mannosyltransferase